MKKRLAIKIYGRVIGVFFRFGAKELAEKLNLSGFIENKPDGTVYLEVEGEESDLEKFLDWCRVGPKSAKVERAEYEYSDELKNFKKFTIKY